MNRIAAVGVLLLLSCAAPAQDKAKPTHPGVVAENVAGGKKTDHAGDPLPRGAVARFGSQRYRINGWADCTALSPDGKILACAGSGAIFLVDLESGQRKGRLSVGPDAFLLAFLEKGQTLFTVNSNGVVRYWSVESGKEVRQPLQVVKKQDQGFFDEGALDPSGRLLVVREEGQFSLWDLQQGKRTIQFMAASEGGPIALAPGGKTIAALDADGQLCLWDAVAGKKKQFSVGKRVGYLSYLQFSPDGKWLISAGTYHAYRVWDVDTGKEKYIFGQPEKNEFAMTFSPDGRLVATTHNDGTLGTLRVWDLKTGKEVSRCSMTAEGFNFSISAVHFSLDHKKLITAGDAVVRTWDVATGAEITKSSLPQHPAAVLVASADGKALAATYGHTLRVWDVKTAKERFQLPGAAWQTPPAFSRDHGQLAYAHTDNTVRLCDVVSGKESARCQGHHKEVTAVIFGADKKTLISVAGDVTLRTWDVISGKELSRHELDTPKLDKYDKHRYDTFSSDGQILTTRFIWTGWKAPADPQQAGWTYEHRVWHYSTKTGERLFTQGQAPPELGSLGLAPDGRTFAGIGSNGALDVFDTATGKKHLSLRAARKDDQGARIVFTSPLAFSPDGRFLAAGDVDNRAIELWDLSTGKLVLTIPNESGRLQALAFVGTANLLASSGADTTILLWDIAALRGKLQK